MCLVWLGLAVGLGAHADAFCKHELIRSLYTVTCLLLPEHHLEDLNQGPCD